MAETWGLAGFARSGLVELELDEAVESDKFALTLTLPTVELRFTIANITVISTLSQFLVELYGQTTHRQLHIGALDGLSVCLIKDDEHRDRFFVRASADGMIDISIVDPIASDLLLAAQGLVSEVSAP